MIPMLLSILAFAPSDDAELFQLEKEITIRTGEQYLGRIMYLDVADDGSIFAITNSSSHGFDTRLFKATPEGELAASYDKRGQGPGEITNLAGVVIHGERVFVAERTRPIVHIYDLELNPVRDVATKLGGTLVFADENRFGVWNTHGRQSLFTQMLAVYPHDLVQRAPSPRFWVDIPSDDLPHLVQAMGDATQTSDGRYLAVYATGYQVWVIDPEQESSKQLFRNEPGHIIPYSPYGGNKTLVDQNLYDWLDSFTKFLKIFSYRDTILLLYSHKEADEDRVFMDAIDLRGEFLFRKKILEHMPVALEKGVFYLS